MYVDLVLVNRLGGLSLLSNSVSRTTDSVQPDLNSVDWAVKPCHSNICCVAFNHLFFSKLSSHFDLAQPIKSLIYGHCSFKYAK